MNPPFPLSPGDHVNFLDKHGFQTGLYVSWNEKKDTAVVKRAEGGRAQVARNLLRPCNDGHMVRLRGIVEYRAPQLDAPKEQKGVKRG